MPNPLRPGLYVHSFSDLSADTLRDANPDLKGFTIDLDSCFVDHHASVIPPDNMATLKAIHYAGISVGVISNATKESRMARAAGLCSDISDALGATVPLAVSGNFDGQRKPKPAMYHWMAQTLGLEAEQMGHVGDQAFKDVLGANLAGYGLSVLVDPFGSKGNLATEYLQRPVERVVMSRILGQPYSAKPQTITDRDKVSLFQPYVYR